MLTQFSEVRSVRKVDTSKFRLKKGIFRHRILTRVKVLWQKLTWYTDMTIKRLSRFGKKVVVEVSKKTILRKNHPLNEKIQGDKFTLLLTDIFEGGWSEGGLKECGWETNAKFGEFCREYL